MKRRYLNDIPAKEYARIEKELKVLISTNLQLLAGISRGHNVDQQEILYWWQNLTDGFIKNYESINGNIKIDGITIAEAAKILEKLLKNKSKGG